MGILSGSRDVIFTFLFGIGVTSAGIMSTPGANNHRKMMMNWRGFREEAPK